MNLRQWNAGICQVINKTSDVSSDASNDCLRISPSGMTSPCVREHVTERLCVAAHHQMNDFETSSVRFLSKGHVPSSF